MCVYMRVNMRTTKNGLARIKIKFDEKMKENKNSSKEWLENESMCEASGSTFEIFFLTNLSTVYRLKMIDEVA